MAHGTRALGWVLLAAASAGVASAATGCGKKESAAPGAAKAAQAVPVDVAPVRVGTAQRTVDVVGTLVGEEDATISNKVNGKVIAIYKDVGDRAEPGEPLAQLLRNDYLLSVNQKRSALLESLAKLGVNDLPGDDYDIGSLPAVRRAKLQSDNAGAKLGRGQQLFDEKPRPLISPQELEDLVTAANVAKSNYDVEAATARGLIGEARTRLADLRIAEQALADTTIRAPQEKYAAPNADPTTRPSGDGAGGDVPVLAPAATVPANEPPLPTTKPTVGRYVIADRMASVGELKQAVTPMFRLVDDDPLKLKASVPARYFPQLAIGQKVSVRVDAYPDRSFEGTVTRINPQVDAANRTFPIEVLIPNADRKLPPGDFARGSVRTTVEGGVVFVPAQAVVSFAGNDKVFLVDGGKAQERQVKLGERTKGPAGEDWVEVTAGLKGGETIAVTGTSRLATGVAVDVKKASATAPAGGSTGVTTVPSR